MDELPGDGAAGAPARRISDDDRQRVVDHLRDAAGRGVIDLQELEERIGSVYQARTAGELEPVTRDLPAPSPKIDPGHQVEHRNPLALEDDEFRGHLTTYCLVIGMLVVIWLVTGFGHPWPIYPALGWGIGLGSHYQRAATHQRKRLTRARSLGISMDELTLREEQEAKAKRASRREARERRRVDGTELARTVQDRVSEQLRAVQPPPVPSIPPPLGAPAPVTQPPEAPAAEAVAAPRRYVAAMFVDVVGSTGLNEALGDEGWVRVRDHLRETLRECFEREGGREVNTAGDGVLARFDHPSRAACAAVEVMRRLEAQRAEAGFAPSVRIGIHSGDVVESGDDMIGSVVNLAARVTAAAEPDQITVTEHVADHLDRSFHTEDRGIHSLRGVSRPRHLLSIRWR